MKKFTAVLLVLTVVLCAFVGCSKKAATTAATPAAAPAATPAATPVAKAPAKSVLNVCLASEPDTLDPALNSAVDGATMIAHLFSGLAKWSQDANGNLILVPDCAQELVNGVNNADGTVTYTYKLRDGLKWSDGKDLTAFDFEFAWNRAASEDLGADYAYMFEVVDGYADGKLNIKAVDAKTFQVTTANYVAYWNELLAFPVYFPVREDVVANEGWATDPSTYVGNGPYKMVGWDHNSLISLEKNPYYVDAAQVTLDVLNCYLSDDANNMLANFESGAWQMIDDVPTEEINALKVKYPTEFVIAGQIGTYYVCWNVNENILPKDSKLTGEAKEKAEAEIRNAIGLLFDRNYIVEEIGQAGQVPASSFVAMGMTNADGTEFYKTAGKAGNPYYGYYAVDKDSFSANVAEAIAVLKKYYNWDGAKFTNFPSLTYLYNTSSGHQAIGEYLQSALAAVGINMGLVNQEWNTFLNTRKDGDYSIARNGWVADYNDPICFLDMWVTASGNNDVQYGKGEHAGLKMYNLDLTDIPGYTLKVTNGTWAETYDVLIAFVKTEVDNAKRSALMHKAEDLLMSTGCIVPLYYYTDLYMIDDSVSGFFSNPLGYKYFMYCTVK